jgi:hypothetical protein
LCDTCFAHKFRGGYPVVDDGAESATGIEITPRMQRWILSSGAMLYLAVVSFGIITQGERLQLGNTHSQQSAGQRELVMVGGNDFPVKHHKEFGFLVGPAGDLITD